MKVSIIIPVYKAENYVARCAHSLFQQSLKDIQFIFVDDCSPDNSIPILKEVIDEYPSLKNNIQLLSHNINRGVAASRNTGLSVALGEYIAYCDSDDYVDSCMYEKMYNKAKLTNSDAVLCDFYMHFAEDDNRMIKTIKADDVENTLRSYISFGWTLISTLMVRKDIYNIYDITSSQQFCYCEDFDLNFRLLYKCSTVTKVSEPLYYYNRINANSVMHNLDSKAYLDERIIYLRIIEMCLNDNSLKLFEKELSWRILKNKQDLVLDSARHVEFLEIFPISHQYIISCPRSFCNNKIKIMMWLLTHHCRPLLLCILFLRKLVN